MAPSPSELDDWARGILARSSPTTGRLVALACPRQGARAFRLTYAAFRILDDEIDTGSLDATALTELTRRVEAALSGEPEEAPFLAALHAVRRGPLGERLAPALDGMWAAQRYDIARRHGPLARPGDELLAQRARIGDAYVHALWVCADAPGSPPTGLRPLARAATGAHWLRDLDEDRALGFCNVPAEVLADLGLSASEASTEALSAWLPHRRAALRQELEAGRAALSEAPPRARLLLGLLSWRYGRLLRGGGIP